MTGTDPVTDFIEKTLADSPRKEIDQEENVIKTTFQLIEAALRLAHEWSFSSVDGGSEASKPEPAGPISASSDTYDLKSPGPCPPK